MEQIEITALLLGAIASILGAMAIGRGHGGEAFWSWAFAMLGAGGACHVIAQSHPAFNVASALLMSAFPIFMLAGAYHHARRRSPAWLPAVGLSYCVIQASMNELGWLRQAQMLGAVVEPTVLIGAGLVMRKAFVAGATAVQRFVPLSMLALAIALVIQRVSRSMGSEEILWFPWLALGMPALSLLVLDTLLRSRESAIRVRENLDEVLSRFRAIASSAYDLIVELDASSKVIWVSPSVTKVLGYAPEEMIDRLGREFIHPEDRGTLRQALSGLGNDGSVVHPPVRVRVLGGEWRWVEGTARRYRSGEGIVRFAIVARDVTERIATGAALVESQNRLEKLGEHSRDVFGLMDGSGNLTYVSPNVERMFGFPAEEFLGLSVRETALKLGTDSMEKLDPILQSVDRDGGLERLARLRHSDGSAVWVETYLNTYEAPNGETHSIAVTRDVTERVLIEDNLRAAQKHESLALLAGGIAHDFNNALMGIVGNVAILQERMDARSDEPDGGRDPELHPVIAEVEAAADRASSLTRQLLAYAGRGELRRQLLNLSDLARGVTRLVERTLPNGASLEEKLADSVPVEGDDSGLRQAILILVTNARESLPAEGGRISISTGVADLDAETLRTMELGEGMPEGEYAFLEVRDTGHGMDAVTRTRIFDPFFTTRGNGRGLGLANLLGIARSHDAAIDTESAPGQGTRIRIYFPVADVETTSLGPEVLQPLDPDWRGSGTILVVDDEEAIRRLAVRALTSRGFTVLTARDGREAVELFRRHADEIRVVVMDVVMPEMRGDEAYLAMREYDPDVRVVLSSGYGVDEFLDRVPAEDLAGFLHKPYRHESLLQRIREILDPQ